MIAGTNFGVATLPTFTSGGGASCAPRRSLRCRAQARFATPRSVSDLGGRRRGAEAVMTALGGGRLTVLASASSLFLFRSILCKSELVSQHSVFLNCGFSEIGLIP